MKSIIYYQRVVRNLNFLHIADRLNLLLIDHPEARIYIIKINFIKEGEFLDCYFNLNFNKDLLDLKDNFNPYQLNNDDLFKLHSIRYSFYDIVVNAFINSSYLPHNLILKNTNFAMEDIMNIYQEYTFLITIQYKEYENTKG